MNSSYNISKIIPACSYFSIKYDCPILVTWFETLWSGSSYRKKKEDSKLHSKSHQKNEMQLDFMKFIKAVALWEKVTDAQ